LASFFDDQRPVDVCGSEQTPGMNHFSAPVADRHVLAQTRLEFVPLLLEKAELFATDKLTIPQ